MWVRLFYNEPYAQIIINGNISQSFMVRHWRRQGCPLAPLLFILESNP